MTRDTDARGPTAGERAEGRTTRVALLAAALLAVAVGGAATAGVLGTVGPYLLGVSALVLVLFALSALGWR